MDDERPALGGPTNASCARDRWTTAPDWPPVSGFQTFGPQASSALWPVTTTGVDAATTVAPMTRASGMLLDPGAGVLRAASARSVPAVAEVAASPSHRKPDTVSSSRCQVVLNQALPSDQAD
ncbi:hypothetical protein AB0K24_47170, partial [Streptomyces mirabilis]|uniref:hypothetical protein n=1 Tax=Streptomyces mirabilis TaxID=68239 RepID=UPI00344997EB